MDINTLYGVIGAVITMLGSAGAWKYYENRATERLENDNFIRLDCRDRIAKLEVLLQESSKEKDVMRETILYLTTQVAELRVKVDYLEGENSKLKRVKRDTKHADS
jgi:hypothetical protein